MPDVTNFPFECSTPGCANVASPGYILCPGCLAVSPDAEPSRSVRRQAVARGTVAESWQQRHAYADARITSAQHLAPTPFAVAASSVVGALVDPVEDASVIEADHAEATPERPESAHFSIAHPDGSEGLVSIFAGGSAVFADGRNVAYSGQVLDVLAAMLAWLSGAEVAGA